MQRSCQGADGAAAGSSDVPATVEEDMSARRPWSSRLVKGVLWLEYLYVHVTCVT